MNYPNIGYILFRHEGSNELSQAVLLTKKDNWSYYMLLQPGGGDREDLELFAKFRLNADGLVSGFMRYHLDDEERGWQGLIVDDEVEPGEITFMDYTAVEEFTPSDKEAFVQLHEALYQIVYHDDEEDLVFVNDELLENMEDEDHFSSENWPMPSENNWIPAEFALYYLDYWHGETIYDL